MGTQWVDIGEAARVLGVSPKTVRRRLKKGLLEAKKESFRGGYRWLVRIDTAPEEARVDEGTQVSPQVSTLEMEGLIKVATGPLEREIRSLKRLVKEERTKVEQLAAQYGRSVGQIEGLEEKVRLLTAPGAQPSWVQRVRDWWGRRG